MHGRHKPGCATYYPVLLKPRGPLPKNSSHPDIDINAITLPEVEEYNKRLNYVLTSSSQYQYEQRRKETGISKPSLLSGLPKSIPVPKCFPADTMHLYGLNIPTLLMDLWQGKIDHDDSDDPSTWEFAVFADQETWEGHGDNIAGTKKYIPCCIETWLPRNPAEKISSGYKAVEYLMYIYWLCSAYLYGILPDNFYQHFCKLVYAARIIHRHEKSKADLIAAHIALLEFVIDFEYLYYRRDPDRLHFIRPCIHALIHIIPEIF